jgi:hypothetical protein
LVRAFFATCNICNTLIFLVTNLFQPRYSCKSYIKSSTTNPESTNCLRDYETYAHGSVIGTWKVCVLKTEVQLSEN